MSDSNQKGKRYEGFGGPGGVCPGCDGTGSSTSHEKLCAGLDLSLTTIGWAVVDSSGDLVDSGYYRISKDRPEDYDSYDLYRLFYEKVFPKIAGANAVGIEQIRGFGRASGKLVQRGELLGMIKLMLHQRGYEVHTHHPSSARKVALGTGKRPDGWDDTKQWILDVISQKFGITWTRTRYDNIRSQHEDEADAIVVALATLDQ